MNLRWEYILQLSPFVLPEEYGSRKGEAVSARLVTAFKF